MSHRPTPLLAALILLAALPAIPTRADTASAIRMRCETRMALRKICTYTAGTAVPLKIEINGVGDTNPRIGFLQSSDTGEFVAYFDAAAGCVVIRPGALTLADTQRSRSFAYLSVQTGAIHGDLARCKAATAPVPQAPRRP